jgi:hypothetical protein
MRLFKVVNNQFELSLIEQMLAKNEIPFYKNVVVVVVSMEIWPPNRLFARAK